MSAATSAEDQSIAADEVHESPADRRPHFPSNGLRRMIYAVTSYLYQSFLRGATTGCVCLRGAGSVLGRGAGLRRAGHHSTSPSTHSFAPPLSLASPRTPPSSTAA